MSDTEPLPNRATTLSTGTGPRNLRLGPIIKKDLAAGGRPDCVASATPGWQKSKSAEWTQLERGTLNRYLLILKRLIFESSVRAGSPSLVAAPDGPEIRP